MKSLNSGLKVALGVALASVLLVGTAQAQMTYDMSSNTFSAMPYMPYTPSVNDIVGDGTGDVPSRSPVQSRPDSSQAAQNLAQAMVFQVSPARRQANIQVFIAQVARGNPEVARGYQTALSDTSRLEAIQSQLRAAYGFEANSVADAYALWLCAAWSASVSSDIDITRAQFQAVRAQLTTSLASVVMVTSLSDAGKQQTADSLFLNTLNIDEIDRRLKSSPTERLAFGRQVATIVKQQIDFDLDAVTLTNTGFARRQSTSRPVRR